MSHSPADYLRHILDEIEYVRDQVEGLPRAPRHSRSPSGEPRVPPFPVVDHSRDIVVGLALGRRGDGNTAVTIDSLTVGKETIVVHTTEHDPCWEQRYFSNPAHVVAVPRRDLKVSFALTTVIEEPCRIGVRLFVRAE